MLAGSLVAQVVLAVLRKQLQKFRTTDGSVLGSVGLPHCPAAKLKGADRQSAIESAILINRFMFSFLCYASSSFNDA